MTEAWVDVVGYPHYEVSTRGRVRRKYKRNRWPAGGIMCVFPNADGYLSLYLRDTDGVRTHLAVHRLVLTSFRGAAPAGSVCRHLDGDRVNSALNNLVWGTPQENGEDTRRHSTLKGVSNGRAKLTAVQVKKIRRALANGTTYAEIMTRYNISEAHVWRVKSVIAWAHV